MGTYNNIIGEPLNSVATGQIAVRSNLLSTTGNRTSEGLTKFINNGAWMRMSSCIDIVDTSGKLAKKFNQVGGKPSSAAQQWVLFGGVTPNKGKLKSGLESYSVGLEYPRGELGFRPMPGLVSISVTTSGPRGSLREATVKIRANTIEQLDALDTLYFRLGFSCLIEWGHVMFQDNNGNLQDAATIPGIDIFNPSASSKEAILTALDKKREQSCGNYDGMLGVISNYSWQANPDGSYDCTVRLVGIGSIIDSLKVNGTTGGSQTPAPPTIDLSVGRIPGITVPLLPGQLAEQTTPVSTVEYILTKLKESILKNPVVVNSTSGFIVCPYNTVQDLLGPNYLANSGLKLFPQDDTVTFATNNNPKLSQDFKCGFIPSALLDKISDSKRTELSIDFRSLTTLHAIKAKQNSKNPAAGAVPPPDEVKTYIKLGFLLALLNNSCLMYDTRKGTKSPYIYIDFNPKTNFCYANDFSISVDPDVCLIDPPPFTTAGLTNMLSCKNISATDIDNIFKQVPNLPTPKQPVPLGEFRKTGHPEVGNLMEIQISIDYLIALLRNLDKIEANGNVNLSSFLAKLLQDVQASLGNVNKFSVGYDDVSNCIQICDDQLLPFTGNKSYTPIPVYGISSVVTAYSLNTETNTRLGSALSISARDPNNKASNASVNGDVSSFSARNLGIRDRVTEEITTDANSESLPTGNADTSDASKAAGLSFMTYLSDYYSAVFYGIPSQRGPANLDIDYKEAAMNYYKGVMNILKENTGYQNTAERSITANAVMPIACSLTMPGISTMVRFEGFTLPGNRLPSQYLTNKGVPKVAFAITKLTHTIENNLWSTQVVGSMINIDPERVSSINPPINNTLPQKFSRPRGKDSDIICGVSYKNGEITSILQEIDPSFYKQHKGTLLKSDGGKIRLLPEAIRNLQDMLTAAKKDGIILKVNDAFRSYTDQVAIWRNHCTNAVGSGKCIAKPGKPTAATPGYSNHGFGLAVDLANKDSTRVNPVKTPREWRWLEENRAKYGFQNLNFDTESHHHDFIKAIPCQKNKPI